MADSPDMATAADAPRTDVDARMHEEQWRKAQMTLALPTPILGFIALVLNLMGSTGNANIALALTIIAGAGAALTATQVWRWSRMAVR